MIYRQCRTSIFVGLIFSLILFLTGGCSIANEHLKVQYKSIERDTSIVSSLTKQYHLWKGTPYKLGGMSHEGIDCSGFAQMTFKNLFGLRIARTTAAQAKQGIYVAKDHLKAGDLVFFKTGRGPFGNHVGIYVKNGQFLHASSKKGVIYSDLKSPYYTKVYWQARRLL